MRLGLGIGRKQRERHVVDTLAVYIDPGPQDTLPLKARPLGKPHRRNVSRISEQADPLQGQFVERPAGDERERVRDESLPSRLPKKPVADRRATVYSESEPDRADTLSSVKNRELGALGCLPPRYGTFDDRVRGDATVVEPAADLRILERCLHSCDIRRNERTQRNDRIGERRIRRMQLHPLCSTA